MPYLSRPCRVGKGRFPAWMICYRGAMLNRARAAVLAVVLAALALLPVACTGKGADKAPSRHH